MKLYVASAFGNASNAQKLMDGLVRAGHEITRDWTREVPDPTLHRAHALADVKGVRDADALILLNHPETRGACVEMGLALAWGKLVYVLDREVQFNIFTYLQEVTPCRNLEELMHHLVNQSGR